ncbi:MAG TPA: sigma-70 family RNA polymerase sigma factor [Bryobacteraceae bacterium]|nr:sigma-70 family RNA polymerase sigma factor [Bryobacteraceae bacterium]
MATKSQISEGRATRMFADLPEYELVQLAQMGTTAAFEELVYRTTDLCLRVACCVLGSSEDARDEVQNAFWLAYSRLELFTYQSKFSTWLVRIVINRCLMRLRVNQRRPVLANEVLNENGEWYTWDAITRETPEAELGRHEVREAVRRELRGMPPLLRTPIEMHFINELPVKDVAKELGLTVAAAKSRLHRGHLYLRERMLKHAAGRGPCSLTAR